MDQYVHQSVEWLVAQMMKKTFFMLAVVCAAVCCLSACTNEYDALNAMLNADYSKIVITVTDTFDENTRLQSEYIMCFSENETTVNYTVEKFAIIGDSFDNLITDVKTVLTGEAVIRDGVIVSVNGDDVNLPALVTKRGLNFKKRYFENVQLTGLYLEADVKNASGFLGIGLTCSNMKVQATFLKVFDNICITYTSESGNQVEYKYVFTL